MAHKGCFLTVGTTEFEGLLALLNEEENAVAFIRALQRHHVTKLVLQIGRGKTTPSVLLSAGAKLGVEVSFFRFAPSLNKYMAESDLIVSHAGAGSILEALRLKRSLIVVVNETLMDNHQVELAEALSEQGYLFTSRPSNLVKVLSDCDFKALKTYPNRHRELEAFSQAVTDQMRGNKRVKAK